MEASRDPGFIDDGISTGSPPPELMEDIQVSLSELLDYDVDRDADAPGGDYDAERDELDQVGPKVELTGIQCQALLISHLAESAEAADGWYKDETRDDPQSRGDRNRGVILKISIATELAAGLIKQAVEDGLERGLIEAKTGRVDGNIIYQNLRLTPEGWDVCDNLRAVIPDDMRAVEAHVTRRLQLDVIPLRREVNHERRVLGLPAYNFEPLERMQTLDDLKKHHAWLRSEQAKQLAMLGESPI